LELAVPSPPLLLISYIHRIHCSRLLFLIYVLYQLRVLIMSLMKSLLKKYKAAPRNDESSIIPTVPVLTPKQQYLLNLWKENNANTSPHSSSEEEAMSLLPACVSKNGLGLLFIIIDALPFEWVWRSFIQLYETQQKLHRQSSSSPSNEFPSIRVWIHAKYPSRVKSPWVRSHLVNFCISAEWGSVDLTKIMVRLLDTAINETTITKETETSEGMNEKIKYSGSIGKFCFVSESCLPATLPGPAMREVEADGCSWIRWTRQPNNGYAKQGQFDKLAVNIPTECIAKADQWLLLNRQHAVDVLDLVAKLQNESMFYDGLYGLFSKVHASDEMFFPTCLSLLGHLPTSSSSEGTFMSTITRRRVTFCNWTEDSARNPMTFTTLLPPPLEDLSHTHKPNIHAMAVAEGCLLMRKLRVPETGESRVALGKRVLSEWLKLISAEETKSDLLSLLENTEGIGNSENEKEEASNGDSRIRELLESQCLRWVDCWLSEEQRCRNVYNEMTRNDDDSRDDRRYGGGRDDRQYDRGGYYDERRGRERDRCHDGRAHDSRRRDYHNRNEHFQSTGRRSDDRSRSRSRDRNNERRYY